jgi:hypothetical protein
MTIAEADEMAVRIKALRDQIKPLKADEEGLSKMVKASGFTKGDHFSISVAQTKKTDWENIAREMARVFDVSVMDFETLVTDNTKFTEVQKLNVM